MPIDTSTLNVGFQTAVENNGAILIFDLLELNTNPFANNSLIEEQLFSFNAAGNTFQDRSGEVRFPVGFTVEANAVGEQIITAVDNAGSTRTEFTALKKCNVTVSGTASISNAGFNLAITKNSTNVERGSTASSNGFNSKASANIDLEPGDYFTLNAQSSSISNSGDLLLISFHAQSTQDAIITNQTEGANWTSTGPANITATVSNPTLGSPTVNDISYQYLAGSNIALVRFKYETDGTGASTGSGNYIIEIPSEIGEIDTSIAPIYTGSDSTFSEAVARSVSIGNGRAKSNTARGVMWAVPFSSTQFRLIIDRTNASGINFWGSSFFGLVVDCSFDIVLQIPILGRNAENSINILQPVVQTAVIAQIEPNGTNAGASIAGEQTRTINTISGDTSFISLSSNQFVLAPGKYSIDGFATSYSISNNRIALYNVDTTNYDLLGSSEWSESNNGSSSHSSIKGTIEIDSAQTYEIRHFTRLARAVNGLGAAMGVFDTAGNDEVYLYIKIDKVK
jgi:hypothetical protein